MKKFKFFILMMLLFLVSACGVTKTTLKPTTKKDVTTSLTTSNTSNSTTKSVTSSSTSQTTKSITSTKPSTTESKTTVKPTTVTTTVTTTKPTTKPTTTLTTTKSAYELINETFAYFSFNFNGNDSEEDGVTENFTLMLQDTNGVKLSYTSDNDAIKIEGSEAIVTRKKADTVVTIKVTASYGLESYSINIKLTVIKKEVNPNDGDLYFSEYIEDSKKGGNDKFLEIYNNTGRDIDLSEYSVKTFSADSITTTRVLSLSGTIKDGEVIVIAHPQYKANVRVDFKGEVCYFSGTHAIALYHDDELIDIIGGPIGSSGLTHKDFLTDTGIERNGSLIRGNTEFDPSEWTSFSDADYSGLGVAPAGETIVEGVSVDFSKMPKNITLNGQIPNFSEYVTLKEDGVLVNLTSANFDTSNIDVTRIGNYQVNFSYTDKKNQVITQTLFIAVVDASYVLSNHETIQDAIDRNAFGQDYVYNVLPSTGEVNVLVIPIQFTTDLFTQAELEMIEKGFFGENLAFESLKSFYYKSSYGKLNMTGEVLAPVTARKSPSYYESATVVEDGETYSCGVDMLIEEALTYYLSVDPNLDLSKYDSDNDGYFDAVHLIYSCDYSKNLELSDFYWAYQYFYYPSDSDYYNIINVDGIEVSAYVFSSVEFFYEDEGGTARTIIHETGHLFGLDDYYDYEEDYGVSGGLGGADMMDDTCGDHNAFSKILLNWIDPIVVTNSCEITLNKFSLTGDVLLLAPNFSSSIFSEYLLISFFTPTELNADNYYLTEKGIIIYHVDAKLITINNNFYYSNYFEYNNSDANKSLIKIVEADNNNSISKTSVATNSDLLKVNQTLNLSLANGKVFATIKVNSMSDTQATVTINFVQ